ncbi:hypothetical protein S40288_09761 [Stachybotrys chartarum IBT 40288]|nr:hypothetical protein S40288_09761 [Stachybotrys chartarum IBT 40288]
MSVVSDSFLDFQDDATEYAADTDDDDAGDDAGDDAPDNIAARDEDTFDEVFEGIIPPPPPSGQYSTLDELYETLHQFYKVNGAAIVKKSPSNYAWVNGIRQPTYCKFICDRGPVRVSQSVGLRKASTAKIDCPFQALASAPKKAGHLWSYRTRGQHNHPPSLSPAAHPTYRKRTTEQKIKEAELFLNRGLAAREMGDQVRNVATDESHFIAKDIYNDRAALRRAMLGGLTPTQAWIHLLRTQKVWHKILYDPDDDQKVMGVFWMYAWCHFEKALRNAVVDVFPLVQLQMCVYHINSKVRARIFKYWFDPAAADAAFDPDGPNSDEGDDTFDDDLNTRNSTQLEAEAGVGDVPTHSDDDYSLEGMFRAWQRVIYAPSEPDFESAWLALNKTFGQQQSHIIRYIHKEYLPWKRQWVKCYTDHYRNFGLRVNSPTETAHKDVKSYLVSGFTDLLQLHLSLVQMMERKERDDCQNAGITRQRQRREVVGLGRKWLGNVPLQVTHAAVDIVIHKQRQAARALRAELAMEEAAASGRPAPEGEDEHLLPPCDDIHCTTWNQYALPCSHTILEKMRVAEPLSKELFVLRWWLKKPLDMQRPLMLIRDPDIVTRLRGRPRNPRNNKEAVPSQLGVRPQAASLGPGLSATPVPSPSSQGGRARGRSVSRQLGRSSPASTTRLNASIRRDRSQAEIDELSATPPAPSIKRSRAAAAITVRGTGRRRGREKGRRSTRVTTGACTPLPSIAAASSAASSEASSADDSALSVIEYVPATQSDDE